MLPEDEFDPWHTPLFVVFVTACAINWFYAISRWINLFNSLRCTNLFTDKPAEKGGLIRRGYEPHVTIQICTYNEGPVVRETIKRACQVDWPKHKLHIQVLDDSTDKGSCNIVSDAVASWKADGYDVRRMIRDQRIGYKAGSLRFHFASVSTEFVAHFDADHHMESDFLRRAMPHFFDKDGEEKHDIGVVQAPWGYYNMHQNLLTEADSLGLDVHHVVEQCARGATYQVFGFNGTGGIWRKSAVQDAGGWTWETVTEDLALSYNAFIKGYKFAYVRDIPQRLEVPGNFLAHVQQKHRWTKGFLQVFRYSYWDILKSRKIGWVVKWESFCHITGAMQFPATIICIMLYPFLMLHGIDTIFVTVVAFFPSIEPLLSAIVTCYAKVPGRGQGEHHSFWDRTCRLHLITAYFGLKVGMALFETKAILEGLLSNDATFLTTPKEGLSKTSSSANTVIRQTDDDFLAATATLIGIGRIFTLVHFNSYVRSMHGAFTLVMNITIGFSLVWVNLSFMLEKHGGKHASRMIRLLSFGLLFVLVAFLWSNVSVVEV